MPDCECIMILREKVLEDILAFCELHEFSEHRFGMECAHNNKLIDKIRKNTFNSKTVDKIYAFIKFHQNHPNTG